MMDPGQNYVRYDDEVKNAEEDDRTNHDNNNSDRQTKFNLEQSRRHLHEQTAELPFAVRNAARLVGNAVLEETKAHILDRHCISRPDRANLIPSRHTFGMCTVRDEYYIYGHDERGDRISPGCCGTGQHWTHDMKDSEIITSLDWTDPEALQVASVLYHRSVGYSWMHMINGMLLALCFLLLIVVTKGDGQDIRGFYIIAGTGVAMMAVRYVVVRLDQRVIRMVDETFERSGQRKRNDILSGELVYH